MIKVLVCALALSLTVVLVGAARLGETAVQGDGDVVIPLLLILLGGAAALIAAAGLPPPGGPRT